MRTHFSKASGAALALGLAAVGLYRNHDFGLHFPAGDMGGPGGGGGNTGGDPGGGVQAHQFTDDTMFVPPGGDAAKPVKFGDWRKGYVPQSEVDARSHQSAQSLIEGLGKHIDKLLAGRGINVGQQQRGQQQFRGQQQPQHQQQHQQAPARPDFRKFRGQPVVGGDELADFMEQVEGTTLAPLGALVQRLAAQNQQLTERLTAREKSLDADAQRRLNDDFERRLDTALGSMKIDPKNTPLRDLAHFFFMAHDWQGKEDVDFPKMFGEFIPTLRKALREIDKLEADAAAQEVRSKRWMPSGGNASPNGPQKYRHMSGREVASRVFGSQPSSRT